MGDSWRGWNGDGSQYGFRSDTWFQGPDHLRVGVGVHLSAPSDCDVGDFFEDPYRPRPGCELRAVILLRSFAVSPGVASGTLPEADLLKDLQPAWEDFEVLLGERRPVSHPPGELIEVFVGAVAGVTMEKLISLLTARVRDALRSRRERKKEDWREGRGYL